MRLKGVIYDRFTCSLKQKTKPTHLSSDEGVVASLHVHPAISGGPLLNLECIELVQDQGNPEDSRYFTEKAEYRPTEQTSGDSD